MNDQYPIGTICIGQNFVRAVYRNKMECEITGGLATRPWIDTHTGESGESPCYWVKWADGTATLALPHNLRLPPPKHKEWADEAIRKLKKQSSDHVVVQLDKPIPEECVQ